MRRSSRSENLIWEEAADIKKRVDFLVLSLGLSWVNHKRVYCYRSNNSKARAYARIWGFNRIWQIALDQEPAYVIEVLSEKFDHLNLKRRDEILLHEIAHIPKTFSGSLLPHTRKGKGSFHDKLKTMLSLYSTKL